MRTPTDLAQLNEGSRVSPGRLTLLAAIIAFVAGGDLALEGVLAPPMNLRVDRDLYVATNGVDSNPGTQDQPLATLEAARGAIRQRKQSSTFGTNGCTVWIRQGTYFRSNSFTLDAKDSGSQQAPITYRAFPKETVVFTGAKPITNFAAVTNAAILSRLPASARTNVLVADTSPLGTADYGSLTNRGAIHQDRPDLYSGHTRAWMVELFFDDHRQQLARWPNQDKSEEVWAYTTAPSPGKWESGPTDNWFTYRESNPSTWSLTETVWVHGMWTYWWADSYEQILFINPATNRITTDRPGDYGFSANQPYEALNVLEELDQPGEWVIDRARQRLYFWPPATNANQRTTLSVLAADFVTLTNASNIQFQNLVFECGRASGVSMRRSTNILAAGCTFRNLGNMGVVVGNSIYTNTAAKLPLSYDYEGGRSNRVVGCHMYDVGEGGIVFSGGNRVTLQPSGHVALNNYIHDFNTNIRCYRPAVKLDGVGATVSHAVIHDSPHQAVSFEGNDHLIEYCNIYRVCKDTEDAGAIYSCAGDWRQRGTTIRYNLIQPSREHGIYLDGFTSGVAVYGNVIMDVVYPVLVGGGRDNVTFDNLLIGFNGSVGWHLSNFGTTWAASSITGMVATLKTIDYTKAPYSNYPGMSLLSTDIANYEADPSATNLYELGMAKGNRVLTNIFLSSKINSYSIDTNRIEQLGNLFHRYFTAFTNFTASPTVEAVRTRNFELKASSEPIIAGFRQLPQSQGIYDDPYGLVRRALLSAYPLVLPSASFRGQPLSIPGSIEIEDFDEGPEGDAYHNPDLEDYGNNAWGSGRYRLESPFYIWGRVTNGARSYVVDISEASAWLAYTVNIVEAGSYNLVFSNSFMNGTFHLALDGTNATSGVTGTNATATVPLPKGIHVLTLVCDRRGVSRLDSMSFQKAP